MTADKMFEELGYKNVKELFGDDHLPEDIIEEYMKPYTFIIQFHTNKEILKHFKTQVIPITIPELKAINEKCKELGWLE